MDYVSDAVLETIEFDPTPQHMPPKVVTIRIGDAPPMMWDFLTQSWNPLQTFAQAISEGHGTSYNEHGFNYDTDDQPDDEPEPFEGVQVYTPFDEAILTRVGFERLMARYLNAIVNAAINQADSVIHEPWWPGFTALVDQLSPSDGKPAV